MDWVENVLAGSTVVAAIATTASALFVGYQAMMFRDTLDDPFQANLQNRQIDACAEVISAHRTYIQTDRLSALAAPIYRYLSSGDKMPEPSENFAQEWRGDTAKALGGAVALNKLFTGMDYTWSASMNLQTALNDLSVYASKAGQQLIEKAVDAFLLNSVSSLKAIAPASDNSDGSVVQTDTPPVAEYEAAAQPVIDRRYDIMSGKAAGLF